MRGRVNKINRATSARYHHWTRLDDGVGILAAVQRVELTGCVNAKAVLVSPRIQCRCGAAQNDDTFIKLRTHCAAENTNNSRRILILVAPGEGHGKKVLTLIDQDYIAV